MMRLINDDPVRAAGARAQFLNARQKSFKEFRSLVERNARQVDYGALIGPCQKIQYLSDARRALIVANDNTAFKCRIVAFRIDEDELISLFGEPLEETSRKRGLATPRCPGDQYVRAVWADENVRAVVPFTKTQPMMQPVLEMMEIGSD